jgi:cobalt-zinc-cadmium efflux system membrane fusion protein
MRPQFLLSFAAAAVMMLSLAGCSDDPAPAAEAPKLPPGIVKPEENLKRTLKVAPVAASPFSEMLRVAGRIDFDEQRVSRIGASVTGRVTDLYAVLGQEVKAGQVLARLHSSELGAAQMAFLKAEAQNDLQARNAERARQLFAADVIGRAELQRRESEYAIAAAEARLPRSTARARHVRRGDRHAGEERQHRFVFAGVLEHQRHGGRAQRGAGPGGAAGRRAVHGGRSVARVGRRRGARAAGCAGGRRAERRYRGAVAGQRNGRITGKLIYVGRTVNPQSRTVLVRTELENKDGRLKPAMLATMLIAAKPVERWWCRARPWCAKATTNRSMWKPRRPVPPDPVKLGPRATACVWCRAASSRATASSWKARSTWTTSASAGTGVTGHDDIAC